MEDNYQFPCGVVDQDGDEAWKCEVSCMLVGCKDCKNFNGSEYYERNVPKAVGKWAKRERTQLSRQEGE